jgi:hypothetical protein
MSRDCEPHKGELLELVGIISMPLGFSGCISLGATALVGFPLGCLVLYLAQRDLARMKAATMDPHGEWLTDSAWYKGGWGALVGRAALALVRLSR